jgi:hypothetical protein
MDIKDQNINGADKGYSGAQQKIQMREPNGGLDRGLMKRHIADSER